MNLSVPCNDEQMHQTQTPDLGMAAQSEER
jgi:hypothetical protein